MATPTKPPTQQARVSSALLEAKIGQFDTVTQTMFNQLPQAQQIEISQMAEADRATATKRLYGKLQSMYKQHPALQGITLSDPSPTMTVEEYNRRQIRDLERQFGDKPAELTKEEYRGYSDELKARQSLAPMEGLIQERQRAYEEFRGLGAADKLRAVWRGPEDIRLSDPTLTLADPRELKE